MQEISFFGLGTQWSILIDTDYLDEGTRSAVLEFAEDFERRYSRFKKESEVNAFRRSAPGTFPISEELAHILEKGVALRQLTGGRYDPAIGGLLERAGYGIQDETNEAGGAQAYRIPSWTLYGRTITIDGPLVFDLGGMGKGYCIDRIANVLRERGHAHFLVDGGGDMFGTSKRTGEPWNVAIEYPGKPDTAAGVVQLRNQGLAVSDSFRRRWGKWHHIIDPDKKLSVENVAGCAALAQSAWNADCMTSGLFLSLPENYPNVADTLEGSYLVFQNNGTTRVSPNWPGELF